MFDDEFPADPGPVPAAAAAWLRCGLPPDMLQDTATSARIAAFAAGIAAAERERIAAGLADEAALTTRAEDASVTEGCSWLVRADFSYELSERMRAGSMAPAIRHD